MSSADRQCGDVWIPDKPDDVMRAAFERIDQRKFALHFQSFARGVLNPSIYIDASKEIQPNTLRFGGGLAALFRYGWGRHSAKSATVNREDVKRILRPWYVALYHLGVPGTFGGVPIDAATRRYFLYILDYGISSMASPIHDLHRHIRTGLDVTHVTLKIMSATTKRIDGIFDHEPQKVARHVTWLDTPTPDDRITNPEPIDLMQAYGLDAAPTVFAQQPNTTSLRVEPAVVSSQIEKLHTEIQKLQAIVRAEFADIRALCVKIDARTEKMEAVMQKEMEEVKMVRIMQGSILLEMQQKATLRQVHGPCHWKRPRSDDM